MRCHLQACPNNGLVYGAAGGHGAPHIYSTRRRLMDSYLYADDTVIYSSNVGVKLSFLRWWRRLFFFSTFQPNFEKEKKTKQQILKKVFVPSNSGRDQLRSWELLRTGPPCRVHLLVRLGAQVNTALKQIHRWRHQSPSSRHFPSTHGAHGCSQRYQ